MYRLRLNLNSNGIVRWPNKCAFCGAEISGLAVTSHSKITGAKYYGMGLRWTPQTQTVAYPICQRHAFLARFFAVPSEWTVTQTLIFLVMGSGLAVVFLLCPLLLLDVLTRITIAPFWIYVAFYCCLLLPVPFILGWKVLSPVFSPIRIAKVQDGLVELSFRNEGFFHEFQGLNKDLVGNLP